MPSFFASAGVMTDVMLPAFTLKASDCAIGSSVSSSFPFLPGATTLEVYLIN
jgi:hypothetical protein